MHSKLLPKQTLVVVGCHLTQTTFYASYWSCDEIYFCVTNGSISKNDPSKVLKYYPVTLLDGACLALDVSTVTKQKSLKIDPMTLDLLESDDGMDFVIIARKSPRT